MGKKITLVHADSSKKASVSSTIKQLTNHITAVIPDSDPIIPLKKNNMYFLICGADSELYKLKSVKKRNCSVKLQLEKA